MFKIKRTDVFSLSLIVFLSVGFYFNLFWPIPKLVVTPDFGRSDAWHFSLPTKYFLWSKLQQGELPLWSATIGSGFPILGEGQTGIFYLPNLILYRLFHFTLAYNLNLVLVHAILASGMFLWLRSLDYHPLAALFGALTLSFSGIIGPQLPHMTLLQGISLMPWVMLLTLKLASHQTVKISMMWAIVVSQQLLAGFPQAVFVTLLFSTTYYFWLKRHSLKQYSSYFLYGGAILLAAGLAAIQILPSVEFLQATSGGGLYQLPHSAYFAYPISHLKTLVNPYALGNPRLGTYPPFYSFNGSIFWENSGFIGLVPIVFIGILWWWWRRLIVSERRWVYFLTVICFVSFLLMLGNASPFYIIYAIWPFNLFRVPSRFIWIFVTSLILLSTFSISKTIQLAQKKRSLIIVVTVILTIINLSHLWHTWSNYHLLDSSSKWLIQPQILSRLHEPKRILSIGYDISFNHLVLDQGWQSPNPFEFLRNTLAPNSNLFWQVGSHGVYAGRFLRRPTMIDDQLQKQLSLAEAGSEASISAFGVKLMNLLAIDTVISTKHLTDSPLTKLTSINSHENITLFAYRNDQTLPRAYLVSHVMRAETLEEALEILASKSFVEGKTVLLEESLTFGNGIASVSGEVTVVRDQDTRLDFDVKSRAISVLVVTDTYYPGWEATIDGQPTKIYPANIRQRAVVVPPGDHKVLFIYRSRSFYTGILITGVSLIIVVIFLFFPIIKRLFPLKRS